MRILVSDTSVLIDLERGQLLEATFGLTLGVRCPRSSLQARAARSHNGPQLLRLGLRVKSLDGDGVLPRWIIGRVPALSLADSFAVALAKINRGRCSPAKASCASSPPARTVAAIR